MDKTLWIMVGAPAVGKSYIAKHLLMHGTGWRYISRDEIRFSIITDEDEYFDKENFVFAKFIRAIDSAFNDDGIFNVIADATHLNWASRRKLLHALGQDVEKTWNIIPVVVSAPEVEIISNNDERTGRSYVPRSVIRRMHLQTTDPHTDPYEYSGILYVDNIRNKENKENDLDNF